MFKFVFVAIAVLLSYQVLSVDAGCNCKSTNQACVQTCGLGLIQCIYSCESTPTDVCTDGCLDKYWPIIGGNGEDLDIHLPFVKRDEDPTVMPSSHHRDEDGEGDRGYGERNHGGGGSDGSHNSHRGEGPYEFPPEKEKDEKKHFDEVYDNYKDGPREEFYPKDDFGNPREGYRNRSMAVTSEIFTKTTVSIIALALATACIIAF